LLISPFKISIGLSITPRYEGSLTASEQDGEQRADWQDKRAGRQTQVMVGGTERQFGSGQAVIIVPEFLRIFSGF
jgi:hypothetical protein